MRRRCGPTIHRIAVAYGAAAAVQLVDRIDDLHRTCRTRAGSPVERILDSLVGTPAITAAEVQATYRLVDGSQFSRRTTAR